MTSIFSKAAGSDLKHHRLFKEHLWVTATQNTKIKKFTDTASKQR